MEPELAVVRGAKIIRETRAAGKVIHSRAPGEHNCGNRRSLTCPVRPGIGDWFGPSSSSTVNVGQVQ
jgi:hypothetical protein